MTPEQRRGFPPLCPDLVVELVSPSDAGPRDAGPRGAEALRRKVSVEEVYALTKSMVEHYDDYKDGTARSAGWALSKQVFEWAVPFHDGAVKYFKEKGVWTAKMQAHNDRLIKRQGMADALEQ